MNVFSENVGYLSKCAYLSVRYFSFPTIWCVHDGEYEKQLIVGICTKYTSVRMEHSNRQFHINFLRYILQNGQILQDEW